MAPSLKVATLTVLSTLSFAGGAGAQQSPEPAPPAATPAPAAPAEAAPLPPPPTPAAEAPQDLPPPPPPKAAVTDASPAAPLIQVETPPPAPAQSRRGYRVHDGFYLRLALGLGTGQAVVTSESNNDYEVEGGSVVFQALVGGTPTTGLAVGGLLFVGSLGADRIHIEGSEATNSTVGQYGLIGAFVDGFPSPSSGFHVGGTLALAGARLSAEDNTTIDDFDGGGVGLGAWVGYDAWISSEWSMGGQLQLLGVLTRQGEDELAKQARAGGVSLVFTSLFH